MFGKSAHWWFGKNSLWGKATSSVPKKGGIDFMGFGFNWDKNSMNFTDNAGGKEANLLQYGFMALGVYVIVKMVGK
jgi:hypothetical protein